jgi:S-adenosylmethionine synthetase
VTYKFAVAVLNAAIIITTLIILGNTLIPARSAIMINPPGKFLIGSPELGSFIRGSLAETVRPRTKMARV